MAQQQQQTERNKNQNTFGVCVWIVYFGKARAAHSIGFTLGFNEEGSPVYPIVCPPTPALFSAIVPAATSVAYVRMCAV